MKIALLAACIALLPIGHASADEPATELASPLRAQRAGPPPAHPSDFHLDLGATTLLPLVLGGSIALEVPGHIVIHTAGGVISSAYVDTINSVGVGWGVYDQSSAQLVSSLLNDATFLELGIGIRPAGTPGIELTVSYVLLWSQRMLDMSQLGGVGHYGLDLTIDAIHGELAWQSEPIDHVYFRIALGWAQSFNHGVSLAGSGDAATQAAMHASADALNALVGRYAFGPTLGATMGARF